MNSNRLSVNSDLLSVILQIAKLGVESDLQTSDSEVELSVVIPVFNEAPSLEPLHQRLTEVLRGLDRGYEILFVDDGSTDASVEVLEELQIRDPRTQVIRFRRNFGKTAALAAAFRVAEGDIIVTMDADLQDDPAEIPRLLNKLDEGYDLVCGWKQQRHDPVSKLLPSRFFNWLTGSISGVKLHDFNTGLKACRREAMEHLPLRGELHRYIPALAALQGYRISEIPVQHHSRRFGHSKYGASRLLKGFLDLFTVVFLTRFMSRPLHLFGTIGLLLAVPGFAIGLYLGSFWVRFRNIGGHQPMLLLGVLLILVGMQFFSLGLIAEMLITAQQRDPDYHIRRTLER